MKLYKNWKHKAIFIRFKRKHTTVEFGIDLKHWGLPLGIDADSFEGLGIYVFCFFIWRF